MCALFYGTVHSILPKCWFAPIDLFAWLSACLHSVRETKSMRYSYVFPITHPVTHTHSPSRTDAGNAFLLLSAITWRALETLRCIWRNWMEPLICSFQPFSVTELHSHRYKFQIGGIYFCNDIKIIWIVLHWLTIFLLHCNLQHSN